MCGIFGELGLGPHMGNPGQVLRHRGPDDSGEEVLAVGGSPWSVRLQHRRLSIIDLSPLGRQPMHNEDGTIWITFNGEIFNFQQLRQELVRAGHCFSSATDTETIVHGYEEWGDAVVDRLRGQFAFGIWDQNRRRLLLARDRLGEKPLFYHYSSERFLFASEIKALFAAGSISRDPDFVAIDEYLTYLYFPPPRTAFRGIWKLPAATCLAVELRSLDKFEIRQWTYWDAATAIKQQPLARPADYIEECRELLLEATQLRMIADVPLGISLSGGIDSSAITAMAAQSGEPIQTFSVGFPNNAAFDETQFAGIVADQFKTNHRVLRPDVRSAAYLTTVVRHFDEPFGNPTAILQYLLTKSMREHVTVALAGDGGDELFGGYERYRGAALARMYRKLPTMVTRQFGKAARHLREDTSGRHTFRRFREFAEFAWRGEIDMYFEWVAYYSALERRDLYTPEMAQKVGAEDSSAFLRSGFERGRSLDPISRLGYVDLVSFLSCNCLEYGDRMSMANALEIRTPFTDHKLVEFAFSVPPAAKIRGMTSKWILKKAMERILPAAILNKRKVGFNPPTPAWLANELRPVVAHFLSPQVVTRRGLFSPSVIARIQQDHYASRRDNTFKLWSLLMLELWFRMYLDGEGEEALRLEMLDRIGHAPQAIGTVA